MNNTKVPSFCGGVGQYDVGPFQTLTKADQYRSLSENKSVPKPQAPFALMSSYHSRTFAVQKEHGEYWAIALDVDEDAPPFTKVVAWWENEIGGFDAIAYLTSSATVENPKFRIIGYLAKPLPFSEWVIAAKILNDKAQAAGFKPDRATERAAQLIYLPNPGQHYDYYFWRDDKPLDPIEEWVAEYEAEEKRIEEAQRFEQQRQKEAAAKAQQWQASGRQSLIASFNETNTIHSVLEAAGYARRGNSYRHPNSASGSFSASVRGHRVYSLSPADPLHSEHAHDAFSAAVILFFGGDERKALVAIRGAA